MSYDERALSALLCPAGWRRNPGTGDARPVAERFERAASRRDGNHDKKEQR